jgi:DNA/RNA-binding domain of Phe-tRNA-synthetase-like protein
MMEAQMHFSHDSAIWQRWPRLAAGVLVVGDVTGQTDATAKAEPLIAAASKRLAAQSEGAFPEIRAWRAVFAEMSLKPTQVRCAAEALLRRLRTEGALPRLHTLVDLCNAVSVACAVPIAAFDLDRVQGDLTVRAARGDEAYLTFSGETETPPTGEIVFADAAGVAHARRWCHRQSAHSAIGEATQTALIVIEAVHEGATATVEAAVARLATDAADMGLIVRGQGMLSATAPAFDYRA